MSIVAALHIHTYHSYDCLLRPADIVHAAIQRGIDLLLVCDHDSLAGGLEAVEAARGRPVHVIAGAEYYTELGDVIVLDIEREFEQRDAASVFAEARRLGKLTILPHPAKSHREHESLVARADIIETINARTYKHLNARATEWAGRAGKPIVAGSDAHFLHEIEHALTIFEGDWDLNDAAAVREMLRRAPRRCELRKQTGYLDFMKSQYLKAYKQRRPRIAWQTTIKAAKKAWRVAIGRNEA
jgi:predicted metal-dependent phosphoesterase TrpH